MDDILQRKTLQRFASLRVSNKAILTASIETRREVLFCHQFVSATAAQAKRHRTRTRPILAMLKKMRHEKTMELSNDTLSDKKERLQEPLFKYYSAAAIENVIAHNTLKWAVPCEENDPFEALASGWDLVAVKESYPEFSPEQTQILDGFFDARGAQKRVSHIASFVSFTEDEKNVLMWSHYAENYTGVCLEFDRAHLQKIDCLRKVSYAKPDEDRERFPLPHDNQKDNDPEYQKRARAFLAKKGHEWHYEKEWRLIVPPMADFIVCTKGKGGYILVSDIPDGAITRMIFGRSVPVSTRIAWAKGIRRRHNKCLFAEAVPDDKKYELQIQELYMDVIEPPHTHIFNSGN